jgi:transposase
LLFIDECEVHLNPPLTKIWCRRGEPAKVPSAGDDKKAVVWGAWDFCRDSLIWCISEQKNSREFIPFLRQLLAHPRDGKQLVLVMDNAGYHRANRVKEFLAKNQDALRAFWLPPYSPELNLIERVWRYLKENVTNNYFFGQLPSLIEATKEACRRLATPSDKVLQVSFETGKNLVQAA